MSDTALLEDGRDVADLKVVELRDELGKRGLSKSGNKKDLADRLRGFLLTGTGEVSEKSASNSPVKSPVNSLVAQYRSTQQQLLKDVQKESEPTEEVPQKAEDEVVENGHKESDDQMASDVVEKETVETQQAPVKEEEEEASALPPEKPIEEETAAAEEKELTPVEEEKQPSPPKEVSAGKEETSHLQESTSLPSENVEEPVEQQIPRAVTPIADRERSKTPEREITPPPPATEDTKEEQKVAADKTDAISRAISEEPADDEEERVPSPSSKNLQQVSGDESGNESRSPTPKSQSSDAKIQQQSLNLNGKDERSPDEDDEKEQDGSKRKSQVFTQGIVYVKDEVVKPNRKTSIISQNEVDLTSDGLVRHKSVSPAKRTPTNFVHIRGLRRPFTLNQFHVILLKFGTFTADDDEWMDSLRSQSIIKFSTVEEAQKARDGLHHVVWPEFNGSELLVDFTDEEEFIKHKGIVRKVVKPDDDDVFEKEKSPSPMHEDLPSPKEVVKRERQDADDDTDEAPSRKKKRENKNLEDLFKRTIAQPSIYYLPLSDEEVARKQAQKAIEKREVKEPEPPTRETRRTSRSSPRKYRDGPPRRQRSPLCSPLPSKRRSRSPGRSSPLSKRRSPSPRRSPPSSRKPAASPPQRRRSHSPRESPRRRR